MEQFVILNEMKIAFIWTIMVLVALLMTNYQMWRLGKKHPEIFQPDTTADDKRWLVQKAELRRQYYNRFILSFMIMMIWSIALIIFMSWLDQAERYLYMYVVPFTCLLLMAFFKYNRKNYM